MFWSLILLLSCSAIASESRKSGLSSQGSRNIRDITSLQSINVVNAADGSYSFRSSRNQPSLSSRRDSGISNSEPIIVDQREYEAKVEAERDRHQSSLRSAQRFQENRSNNRAVEDERFSQELLQVGQIMRQRRAENRSDHIASINQQVSMPSSASVQRRDISAAELRLRIASMIEESGLNSMPEYMENREGMEEIFVRIIMEQMLQSGFNIPEGFEYQERPRARANHSRAQSDYRQERSEQRQPEESMFKQFMKSVVFPAMGEGIKSGLTNLMDPRNYSNRVSDTRNPVSNPRPKDSNASATKSSTSSSSNRASGVLTYDELQGILKWKKEIAESSSSLFRLGREDRSSGLFSDMNLPESNRFRESMMGNSIDLSSAFRNDNGRRIEQHFRDMNFDRH